MRILAVACLGVIIICRSGEPAQPKAVQGAAPLQGKIAIAVREPPASSAVRSALTKKGHEVQDVYTEWDTFHGISALMTGNLDVPRPDFWPDELGNAWDKGLAACRSKAGAPPWGLRNKHAFLCGRELAAVLWQRWLDFSKPEQVMVVEIDDNGGRGPSTLNAEAYRPSETSKRVLTAGGVSAVEKKAVELCLELLAGKGTSQPRTVARALPAAPDFSGVLTGELADGSVLDLPAEPIPEGCSKPLPGLILRPSEAPLAQTIMLKWIKTIKGQVAKDRTFECSLALTLSQPIMEGTSMRQILVFLKCGDERFEAQAVGLSAAQGHPTIAKKLIDSLLVRFCR